MDAALYDSQWNELPVSLLVCNEKKHIHLSNALFRYRYIKFALCSTLLLHIFIELVHCGRIKFQE
jgi:hypothetical protein